MRSIRRIVKEPARDDLESGNDAGRRALERRTFGSRADYSTLADPKASDVAVFDRLDERRDPTTAAAQKQVSICVLTYGSYASLIQRCLASIIRCCERSKYELIVGANAPGQETLAYLTDLESR